MAPPLPPGAKIVQEEVRAPLPPGANLIQDVSEDSYGLGQRFIDGTIENVLGIPGAIGDLFKTTGSAAYNLPSTIEDIYQNDMRSPFELPVTFPDEVGTLDKLKAIFSPGRTEVPVQENPAYFNEKTGEPRGAGTGIETMDRILATLRGIPESYQRASVPEGATREQEEIIRRKNKLSLATSLMGPTGKITAPAISALKAMVAQQGVDEGENQYSQIVGDKEDSPLAEDLVDRAASTTASLPLLATNAATLNKTRNAVATTRAGLARGADLFERKTNSAALVADSLTTTAMEQGVRAADDLVPNSVFLESKGGAIKSTSMAKAIEQHTPEVYTKGSPELIKLTQDKQGPVSGGNFTPVAESFDKVRVKAKRDLNNLIKKLPERTDITYGKLFAPLDEKLANTLTKAGSDKADLILHNEKIKLAETAFKGQMVRIPDGLTNPRSKTPNLVRSKSKAETYGKLYRRVNMIDDSTKSAGTGLVKKANAKQRKWLEKAEKDFVNTKIGRDEFIDMSREFAKATEFKNNPNAAEAKGLSEVYAIIDKNARKMKYEFVSKHGGEEVGKNFTKINNKLSTSIEALELARKKVELTRQQNRGNIDPNLGAEYQRMVENTPLGTTLMQGPAALMPGKLPLVGKNPLKSYPEFPYGYPEFNNREAMISAALPYGDPGAANRLYLPQLAKGRIGKSLAPLEAALNVPATPQGVGHLTGAMMSPETGLDPETIQSIRQKVRGMGNMIEKGFDAGSALLSPPEAQAQQLALPQQPPPTDFSAQPFRRDSNFILQNKDAFIQRAMGIAGEQGADAEQLATDIQQVLSIPNHTMRQQALSELSVMIPGLFLESEYPSTMDGKIHNPMDVGAALDKLSVDMHSGKIDSLEWSKRQAALNLNGSVLPPQKIKPDENPAETPGSSYTETPLGPRREYDY